MTRKPDRTNDTKKAGKMSTAFLRVIGILFLTMFFATVAVLLLPGVFGIRSYYVVSGSMEPQIPTGSMIYVKDCDPANLKEGDVIAFDLGNSVVTHRVTENDPSLEELTTKGDANPLEDMRKVSYEDVIGVYTLHLPYMGAAGAFFSTFYGRLLLVLIGGIGVLLLSYTGSKMP